MHLCEGQTLQSRLRSRPCHIGEDNIACCFGKTVCDVLKRKHPPSVTPPEYVLQSGEVIMSLPHGVIFDSIDASLIQRAATIVCSH